MDETDKLWAEAAREYHKDRGQSLAIDDIKPFRRAKRDDGTGEFSDDALALRLADHHADELRYVDDWGRWLRWDGMRWQFDKTLAVFDLARALCREAASDQAKAGKQLASAKTIAAVEKLARSDRRLAATSDQWDARPFAFNTGEDVGHD